MGVRAPAIITTSVGNIIFLSYFLQLELGAFQRDDRVAATFARFFDAGFGAIDQVCNDILTLEIGLGYGFDDSGAQGDLRGIPRRLQSRSGAAQLVSQVLRAGQ